MAKKKYNNNKGQETMGAKIEDTAVATAVETEEEIIPADGIETEQVGSLGDNGVADSENLVPAPEFKEGVDVEPKVDESEDGGEDMDMEAKVLESELDASKVEEPEESSEIEKEDLYLIQTPSLVDTDVETKTQLEDSTYPPVATEDTDEFKVIDTDTIDTTTLLFNKKTINELILNYMEGDIVLDENTLIPGLTFDKLTKLLRLHKEGLSTGWFFQQFLKLGFAKTKYAGEYYLTWDADTLPLSHIEFFDGNHPYFTRKYEYNENYFFTIERILGMQKKQTFLL